MIAQNQSVQTDNNEMIQIKRKENLEEQHPFILNLFYCFFMPFVCRIKPVTNDDIYPAAHDDRCDYTTELADAGWIPSYQVYIPKLAEYEQKKLDFPDTNPKEPPKPSLFKVMLFDLGSFKLLLAIISLLLSVGFQQCMPSMMKEVLKAVMIKGMAAQMNPMLPPDQQIVAKFPYVHAIILMLAPFMNAIFDTLSQRLIYHFSSQLRSGLAGLMYKKTLLLNITAQSNIDTGRLLSLLSSDTNQIATMSPQLFYLISLPFEIFIPFGFVCYDWGASSLLAFAVIIVSIPLQLFISFILVGALGKYLVHNDERNKVTNETLQGMRVVKLSATPTFVNAAAMTVYITSKNIPQEDFPVNVMSSIGYINKLIILIEFIDILYYSIIHQFIFLTMMTMPFNWLSLYIQAAGMVTISQARVRDFLILPELKIIPNVAPDSEQFDVEIRNAQFRWGDPPEIPLSKDEKIEIENEAKLRLKEAQKEEARKLKEEKEREKE
ncbi:MAG: hypothetical protein EZS28_003326 [Streblomastix strix]|uniref:ABC transmembrane type-1 domain-containing protein n=1 Tax=Streblomastix strix TaxID=222440 RepID=A0A5J4X1V1_9EUKA|nr:MAG: hypothetical protein EZS28_003326 [Streblomastix strix]